MLTAGEREILALSGRWKDSDEPRNTLGTQTFNALNDEKSATMADCGDS